jgi:hypothetical protein
MMPDEGVDRTSGELDAAGVDGTRWNTLPRARVPT